MGRLTADACNHETPRTQTRGDCRVQVGSQRGPSPVYTRFAAGSNRAPSQNRSPEAVRDAGPCPPRSRSCLAVPFTKQLWPLAGQAVRCGARSHACERRKRSRTGSRLYTPPLAHGNVEYGVPARKDACTDAAVSHALRLLSDMATRNEVRPHQGAKHRSGPGSAPRSTWAWARTRTAMSSGASRRRRGIEPLMPVPALRLDGHKHARAVRTHLVGPALQEDVSDISQFDSGVWVHSRLQYGMNVVCQHSRKTQCQAGDFAEQQGVLAQEHRLDGPAPAALALQDRWLSSRTAVSASSVGALNVSQRHRWPPRAAGNSRAAACPLSEHLKRAGVRLSIPQAMALPQQAAIAAIEPVAAMSARWTAGLLTVRSVPHRVRRGPTQRPCGACLPVAYSMSARMATAVATPHELGC